MRTTLIVALAASAALLAAPAASQDLSGIDLSGAWKLKAKLTFEPNEFGVKHAKLLAPVHVLHVDGTLTGVLVDKLPKCGVFLDPLEGTCDAGVFALHVVAPGHDPQTCAEAGSVDLNIGGVAIDNVRATCTGWGEVDLGWFVFPFTLQGSGRRVSGMLTPDDPDGPGPAVPLEQMGSGEPGSEGAHDLAITLLKASPVVTSHWGTGSPPDKPGRVRVRLQNRSQHDEVIDDAQQLAELVQVAFVPQEPAADGTLIVPEAALRAPPPGAFPIVLRPRGRLTLRYDVTLGVAPSLVGDADCPTTAFHVTARVRHEVLAGAAADDHEGDDVAPRGVLPPWAFDCYPDGRIRDRGAGARRDDGTLGDPVELLAAWCE